MSKRLQDLTILIKGAGEMATGIACRLFRANFRRILLLEIAAPLAVRRQVSFCEAVYDGRARVEGIDAWLVAGEAAIERAWAAGCIAVAVDAAGESVGRLRPEVVIDATLAKRNLGLHIEDAPLVIGLGPGFEAGRDCHLVVETNRGHDLGRVLMAGRAEANTGIPGAIRGYTVERVLRSPGEGRFVAVKAIGDPVTKGEQVGSVGGNQVVAAIDGIVRGLIRPGTLVGHGMKIGDIDPRGEPAYCATVSEKANAIGGAVLEAILSVYNR